MKTELASTIYMEETLRDNFSATFLRETPRATRVKTDLTIIPQVGVLKSACVRKMLICISYGYRLVQRLTWNLHGTGREQRRSQGLKYPEVHLDETKNRCFATRIFHATTKHVVQIVPNSYKSEDY